MTTTDKPPSIPVRLDFERLAPRVISALGALDKASTKTLDAVDFDTCLRELVRIRVSQLNGCAYCVDMHSKDARAAGESEQRLYALPVWRETSFYAERERAALTFAESVTTMAATHVPAADYEAVAAHFSSDEIAALLSLIVTINAWNAIGVGARAWEPGSYEP